MEGGRIRIRRKGELGEYDIMRGLQEVRRTNQNEGKEKI